MKNAQTAILTGEAPPIPPSDFITKALKALPPGKVDKEAKPSANKDSKVKSKPVVSDAQKKLLKTYMSDEDYAEMYGED
jgi:hypothetical protein